MKLNIKSRKGFTLIELLVVIGILAVLAAIAIPSVAGLIDRANVSADKTNSNEMTNAIERFASEYELYCQDIASGTLDTSNLDSAQGRVYNVTKATTRGDIETLEVAQDAPITDDMIAIYRDTKYPVNAKTMQLVVQNYTKTSSSTFEPKQSDMHYWYSPDCGVVVVAEPTKTAAELDKYVVSGMDAKGNDITSDSVNAKWIDMTIGTANSGASGGNQEEIIVGTATFSHYLAVPNCHEYHTDHSDSCWINETTTLTWEELQMPENSAKYGYDVSAVNNTKIANFAFVNIPISSIVVPKNVTYIGEIAFQATNCSQISLPNTINFIANDAFTCNIPVTINYDGTKEQWEAIEKAEHWNTGNEENGFTLTVLCSDGSIQY